MEFARLWQQPCWYPRLIQTAPSGALLLYTVFGMADKKQRHDDTTIKIDMDLEHALKKAMDAGPYPAEKPKSQPSRSAPRTKSPGRQPAPKAD